MTGDVTFLTVDDVLEIHRDGIEEFGGLPGVRDAGMIESAVHAAENLFAYEQSSIHELAAAYFYSLCRNHGFVDGNKRVALRAADVFLAINGVELGFDDDEAYDVAIAVATGKLSREELAKVIASSCRPLD